MELSLIDSILSLNSKHQTNNINKDGARRFIQ